MSSVAVLPQPVAVPSAPSTAKPVKTWLVGPWFDLFLVGNIAWPLVMLLAWEGSPLGHEVTLVQLYFLSSAHRWITVFLVAFDREHFRRQPWKFGGLAVGLLALGILLLGIGSIWPMASSILVPLMMLDFVWNAWHFAAQHAGILRIYGRITRPEMSLKQVNFEKTAIRCLVLWFWFRVALAVALQKEELGLSRLAEWAPWLGIIDALALIAPWWLVIKEFAAYRPQLLGRLIYMVSLVLHYTLLLLMIELDIRSLLVPLIVANAVFHAVEYLAVVAWSAKRKSGGVWGYLVPRLGVTMAVFVALVGISNYFLMQQSAFAWALVTLLVSLLHYGYDGIIWKSRPAARPAAARPAPV